MVIPYILISLILGILAILYFRKYDLYEKEPVSKMIIAAVVGGFSSIIITSVIYFIFTLLGIQNFQNGFSAIFIIGPTEELSKLFGLYVAYWFIKKEVNEPVDGLIYMSCVALGFSLIENFSYALIYHNDNTLIFTRFLLATPAHILFSVYMGVAFYLHKKIHPAYPLLIVAFLYGSILHGIWDLMAFNGWWFLFFIFILIIAHNRLIHWLNITGAKSPFRVSLMRFIRDYPDPQVSEGIECLNCNSRNNKLTYRRDKIIIQKCDQCDGYVAPYKSMFHIFHFFGSRFENLSRKLKRAASSRKNLFTLYEKNLISRQKKIAFFKLDELNVTLENMRLKLGRQYETNKFFI